ncbi:hypothetical protein CVT26_009581 [Gymnopilus dilepis]|uniref:Uncharacterized protein n=1 Tax=Gymnopilus dilepis TaxID=231916 RepID=A0A409YII3_9AGAR|nr:hypothetical protein CVT26_009581 [Gymnopilus dilepis]
MILPVGVGNLPKGERYSTMDYIFGSVLQSVMVAIVLISYDVACQWFVNLFTRMERNWPDEIKTARELKFVPAIPKLHYPMHEAAGHHVYSLNYIPGVGLSDCECPERVWAPHNALGNSTKTQAPGSRQDVLDDHFGFWNWLKYVGMGTTLSRKYRAAVGERNVQSEGHRGLTDVLDPNVVKRWEIMCAAWEKDAFPKKKKDPYHVEEETISEARAKKELAAEEAKRLADGEISLHKTSASSFVAIGLEIEETQRRLQRLAHGINSHSTDAKDGSLTEQRNVLRSRLRVWDQLVSIYMPGLLQFLTDQAEKEPSSVPSEVTVDIATKSTHPEDAHVWLPSRIPPSQRRRVCREGLPEIEERLRSGQCHDSLENLRQTLRLKSRMIQFKNQNIRGQRDGTRSRAVIDRIHDRAKVAAGKYRSARSALLSLRGPGDWEKNLRVLEDSDIRGYQDPDRLRPRKGRMGIFEDDESPGVTVEPDNVGLTLLNQSRTRRDGTGETRRTISWIWYNARTVQPDDEKDEILRSEWAKSRARAERAREEVLLLREEMRRVLKYLDWKAKWWRDRTSSRSDISSSLAEGIQAFALAQADVQDLLADHFRKLWDTPLQSLDGTIPSSEETGQENDDGDGEDDDSDSGESEVEEAQEDEDDEPILP